MDRRVEVTGARQQFDRLIALTAALGLPLERVWQSETAELLNIETSDVVAGAVSGLSCDLLMPVISDWGHDFELQISSNYGIRPYGVSSSTPCNPSELAAFLGDIKAAPTAKLELRLRIDKQHFVDTRLSTPWNHRLYLFTRNLKRALQGKMTELQDIFFPLDSFQCHCVLMEQSVALTGRHLFIHHDMTAVPPFAATRALHLQHYVQRIKDVQRLRVDNTRWIDLDTYLTPMHFKVEQDADDSSAIGALISHLQYALIIFYLAETTRSVPEGYLAIVPGPTRTEILIPGQHPVTWLDNSLLYRMFRWCYSERTTDKLDIARSTISSVLGDNKSENYDLLSARVERIWNAARSTYLILVRGMVKENFDQVKQVQDYVTTISTDMGAKVSNIVSNLTTNALAAIGVVLGAFVAYAFDSSNKIRPDVFKVGLFVYGAYIIVFPLGYSLLLNNLTDYIILKQEFDRRLATFRDIVRVPALFAKANLVVASRSRHFWAVFILSVVVYIALAATCFLFWHSLPSN